MDCYGLLTLYFREVLGLDLGPVPQTDIEAGFLQARGWSQCERADALAWMVWRQGSPAHCGLILPDGQYLHSEGTPQRPGSVRVSRPEAVARVYGGDIRFYRYAPC
jgi:cell wall-associated NlpC family hydrolase